jgi:hypothetical protein
MGSGTSGLVEGGGQLADKGLWLGGQAEATISLVARLLPASFVIDEVPERDVGAAFGQKQIAGPKRRA